MGSRAVKLFICIGIEGFDAVPTGIVPGDGVGSRVFELFVCIGR
jgi:hypothetical protein